MGAFKKKNFPGLKNNGNNLTSRKINGNYYYVHSNSPKGKKKKMALFLIATVFFK